MFAVEIEPAGLAAAVANHVSMRVWKVCCTMRGSFSDRPRGEGMRRYEGERGRMRRASVFTVGSRAVRTGAKETS